MWSLLVVRGLRLGIRVTRAVPRVIVIFIIAGPDLLASRVPHTPCSRVRWMIAKIWHRNHGTHQRERFSGCDVRFGNGGNVSTESSRWLRACGMEGLELGGVLSGVKCGGLCGTSFNRHCTNGRKLAVISRSIGQIFLGWVRC